ncbi:STAS domain-containing protein [bacterium]|nr:STAS domain-containing protein [bacterium]
MTNPLIVKREKNDDNGVVTIHLKGRLDMTSLDPFKEVFTQEFSENNHKIVLNMSEVFFIVSTHLGVIMSSYKDAQANGGDLKFSCLTEEVYGIFDLLQLTSILNIYQSDEEAAKEF